jgi:type IV pilus assembly protein PilB
MATAMSLPMEKTLGQILVEKNYISPEQLALALSRQKQEKGKYLGQILIEMGVSQEKINKALDYFNKRKPIGQILLDLQVITPQQLEEALEKQKQLQKKALRKPLGMLLVEMGYTTYYSYLNALSRHFNMPIVFLKNFLLSSSLQQSIGVRYAQQQRIVVLENSRDKIKLALAEPTNHILNEIRRNFPPNKNVEFYLASPAEIENCLKNYFDPFSLNSYR